MKCHIISIALAALSSVMCALGAMAENYPYRDDMLWVTVPDHPDWVYDCGDTARVEVQLYRYGIPLDCEVAYSIGPDLQSPDTEGTLRLRGGRAVLPVGTMTTPGFRDCRLKANVDGAVTSHHIKVGFSPDSIVPWTRMPDDFREFWDANLARLARQPLKYTVEDAPEYSTDTFTASLVRLQVTPRQSVYGYLFVPRDAEPGSCPIVVCPPGAGIKTIKEPLRHRYYADNGCIRFEMEIHGLDPRMSTEQFDQISRAFNGAENGYLTNGLDNRDNYYMQRVYLSLVRAVDYLTTLPEWDGRNVVMQGGSQGGALAIVGAALDPRVTACVANHPALADMGAFAAGRTEGYPHLGRIPGMDSPEKLQTMAYYDTVNFARLLQCPVLMTWGYNDDTCPPTTSYAVWNVITSPKDALITPVNEHWTSDATERGHLRWILGHLR